MPLRFLGSPEGRRQRAKNLRPVHPLPEFRAGEMLDGDTEALGLLREMHGRISDARSARRDSARRSLGESTKQFLVTGNLFRLI